MYLLSFCVEDTNVLYIPGQWALSRSVFDRQKEEVDGKSLPNPFILMYHFTTPDAMEKGSHAKLHVPSRHNT